ncbi:MAG TPA: hypothetical protein VE153_02510, partial [Myxococcus sp.]|nr:hypothetical protein [Myxococcus sp.]
RIYAARVDGDGRVLDPSGLALSGTAMGRQPRVAFDGTFYLVTWLDSPSRVRATRVATTGQVMDPPFRVYDSPQVQSVYAVAGDVFGFLVVWLTPTGGGDQDMMGCRLSGGGTPMGPCPFRIHGPVGSTSGPAVASTGSSFLVVWDGGGDIHGATVSATGTVSPRFPVTSAAGSQVGPDVAGSGSGAFVVWTDSSAQAINGTRVSPEGARLDATDLVLAPPGTTFLWPQAGYDGRDYMVIWRDTRTPARYQVRAARVTPQGTVVNPDGVELGAAGNTQEGFGPASIAGGGGRALAVWEAMGATTQQDIVGTRVGQVTAALDVPPRFISTVGVGQSWPDVAFDGRNYLVAWSDSRADGNGDIYATRVDPTGRVLDPAGIAVATAQAAGAYQWTPKVASSASGFLVTWSEYRDSSARTQVYATLVGGDGRVARPGGLSLVPNANSQEDSSVASDGTNFLVAWRELVRAADGSLQDDFIRSVLVSGASGAPTAVRTLANPSLSVMHPEVAFSGSNYLVVWVDFRGGPSPIHANRVDRAGDVLDGTTGFSTGVPAYSTYADLSLAAGPEGFLLAFYARNWDARRGIFMSRLGSNGRAVASPGVALSAGNVGAVTPEVVFDGMNYVVAWYQGFDPYDVMANRVTPGGVVLDGTGFPVSSTARSEYVPALATDGRGTVLVAYGVQGQVKQRFIRSLEAGQPCTLASDCGSGFCVDGVCCDSACGGGVATDCQACSVAAGGRVDGTCSAVGAGRTCRASAGDCDVAEACDGSGLACPEDGFMEVGTECRASAGGCDVAEACPGTSAACPVDGFAEAGGECRPTAGACDPAEVCSGTARECPEDALLPAGTECRAAVGACDVAERCGGDSALCPENASAPDGTACDDGSACTQTDSCQSGACAGAAPVVCEAPNPCMRAGVCDPATGGCSAPVPVEDGTACNDGNACTQTDTCQAGTCMGASPVVCTGGDACNTAGTCNPATGQCSAPVPVADGTACSDGNACTQTDTCTAGACGGANPVVCAAADACHVAGTCNPTTGVCSDPEAEEGTTCPGGACQAGTCVPTPDAGTADGGTDAGTDAGSEPDAGQTPDAGDTVDGGPGTPRPLPPHDPMGCGCGVPAGSSNMGLLLLIAGAALLRRSRRQRS